MTKALAFEEKRSNEKENEFRVSTHWDSTPFHPPLYPFFTLSPLIKRGFIHPEFAVSGYRILQQFVIVWVQLLIIYYVCNMLFINNQLLIA